jgi:hypothetical protein
MEQAATIDIGQVITLSGFAYLLTVIVALLAAILIRGIVLLLAGAKKTRERRIAAATPVQVAVAPEPAQLEDTSAHVAAIAAAIYAVVGARRLVYIGEARPSYGWTTTGRVFHQTSHAPKRVPQR